MSLIEEEFANVEAEAEARKAALRAAAGLLIEAETLHEEVAKRMPEGAGFCVCVFTYARDKAEAQLLVWSRHAEFFLALSDMGVSSTEISPLYFDERGRSRRTLKLSGFDVPVVIENEVMKEAA